MTCRDRAGFPDRKPVTINLHVVYQILQYLREVYTVIKPESHQNSKSKGDEWIIFYFHKSAKKFVKLFLLPLKNRMTYPL